MPKKKIAFFINSLGGSGAEKVVSLLVNNFCDQFDIHLVLLTDTIDFDIPKEKIHIYIIDRSELFATNRIKDILKIPFLSYKLKKYLHKNNINVCFSFLVRSNYINCFLKLLGWKGKSVISERSHTSSQYGNDSFSGKVAKFLVRHLYKRADVVVPNSRLTVVDLKQNFHLKNPFEVIYNPIDLGKHQQVELLAADDDVRFDKFTFISVGRFNVQKNQLVLLKAVEKIKDKNFQLVLIGQGELETVIKQDAKNLCIADKIIFAGYKANPARYISKSQCFVLSSDWEGFPNALLEAIASGVAVISTDCPSGPREMLYNNFDENVKCTGVEKADYGLLVPVNDADNIAAAMLVMLENDALRNSYAAKGKLRAKDFDLPVIMQQYEKIINEVLLA